MGDLKNPLILGGEKSQTEGCLQEMKCCLSGS